MPRRDRIPDGFYQQGTIDGACKENGEKRLRGILKKGDEIG